MTLPVPVSFGKFDTFYQGLNMDRMEERGWWSESAMRLRAHRYRGDSTVEARRRRRIVRNRQGLGLAAEASVEANLEESFNDASTSSGEGPPEGYVAPSVVSEADLLPSTGTTEGIFFRDDVAVAVNIRVKAAAINMASEGDDVPPTGGSPRCNRAASATALLFAESGPPPPWR